MGSYRSTDGDLPSVDTRAYGNSAALWNSNSLPRSYDRSGDRVSFREANRNRYDRESAVRCVLLLGAGTAGGSLNSGIADRRSESVAIGTSKWPFSRIPPPGDITGSQEIGCQ